MKNRKLLYLVSAVLIPSLLGGCGQTDETLLSDMSVAVQTQQLEIGNLKVENSYIGTVMDVDAVNVVPLVNAEVVSVNVEVGDMVQAGDVLCKLDDTDAQFNLLSAQTNYSNAQVSYKNAQANHEKTVAAYNTQDGKRGGRINHDLAKSNRKKTFHGDFAAGVGSDFRHLWNRKYPDGILHCF